MLLGSEKLLGFIALRVGSRDVKVPICASDAPAADGSLASFKMEGNAYAILVQEVPNPVHMEQAVEHAAEEALRQLSRKFLN